MSTKIGEIAEAVFVAMATHEDLKVSNANSKDCPYDKVTDNGKDIYRIQVKATSKINTKKNAGDNYKIGTSKGSKNKSVYSKKEVDFFACYILPLNVWYIIPFDAVSGKSINLFPHIKNSTGKYEQYKERWDLLQ